LSENYNAYALTHLANSDIFLNRGFLMFDQMDIERRTIEVTTPQSINLSIISDIESNVRTYCRDVPYVFSRALGSEVYDENGRRFIDFMSAAGSLNYGHNDPRIVRPIAEYLLGNGILQTLDFATEAKAEFLLKFREIILAPRQLDYKVQFTGPTGTNAVEAAIKLARKYTGRPNIVAFTNAFHGVSLGALALTGNTSKRMGAGVPLNNVLRLPYDGYLANSADAAEHARRLFLDTSSGYESPAAFILETIQGEGGINVATSNWLKAIESLAKELGALLIIDDIQAGCGRAGSFFSFEPYGISPDIVCLSKSLSGSGLPLAMILLKPGLDVWKPGEHNGTFRGNNLGFVGARAALEYWTDGVLEDEMSRSSRVIFDTLNDLCAEGYDQHAGPVGRGMFCGLKFRRPIFAEMTRISALKHGVITETCGPNDEVLKIMPPINIPFSLLKEGLELICAATREVIKY
jgi:diaminobutyrate-2-oxoglutarate transaminase